MPSGGPAIAGCPGPEGCVYASHMRGGVKIYLPICMVCGQIGWASIVEQLAELRRQVAAEVLRGVDERLFGLPYTSVGGVPRVEREQLSTAVNETACQVLGDDWVALMRGEEKGASGA